MTLPHTTKPRAAATAFGVGFITLIASGALFQSLLVPFGAARGIWAVWGATVLCLVLGIFFGLRDVRRLARESAAIQKLPLVGSIADYEEIVGKEDGPFKNTLVADRVRRVAQAKAAGATADAMRASFRADSASRAAAIGATTRYLASTLLLLSVIGTFAGMKAALPGLYAAVQQPSLAAPAGTPANSPRVDIDGQNIHDALKHVADAFGANFLALVGALGLSVISFGATVDRRRVLVSLERVSDQRLHRLLHSERQLVAQAFVDQLKDSLQDVGTIATQIGGLRQAIRDFTGGTTTAIETFQSSLNGQIRAEFLQAHRDIAEQVSHVVPELTRIANASHTTAVAYEGLVQGLRERDLGLQTASTTLRQASEEASSLIRDAIEPLGNLATGITGATNEAKQVLNLVLEQTQLVNGALRAADAAAATADRLATTSTATIDHLHRGADSIVELTANSGVALLNMSAQGSRLERAATDASTDLRKVAEHAAATSENLAAQGLALSESHNALRTVIDDLRMGIKESFIETERRSKDRDLQAAEHTAAASRELEAQRAALSESHIALRAVIEEFRLGMKEAFVEIERRSKAQDLYVAVQAAADAQTKVVTEIRELVTVLRNREVTPNTSGNGTRRPVGTPDSEVQPARPFYEPPQPQAYNGSRVSAVEARYENTPDAPRRPRPSLFSFWKGRD